MILLRSIIDAAHAPNYNFQFYNGEHEGSKYTLTRIPGGSPSGNDSLRFVSIPTGIAGQYEWGFHFLSSLPAVPQGASRYVRWRTKIHAPVLWDSSNGGRSAGGKLFIMGNNVENPPFSPTRVICNIVSPSPAFTSPFWEYDQNIAGVGGGGDGIIVPALETEIWHNVQLLMQSSSTAVATDARLSIWDNNNNPSAPNGTATGFLLKTDGWSQSTSNGNANLLWGTGAFNELEIGQNFDIELADFEYADSFDPNWHITSTPSSVSMRYAMIRSR